MTKHEVQKRSGFVIAWAGPFVDGAGRWVTHLPWSFQSTRYNVGRDPGDEDIEPAREPGRSET